MNLKREKYLLMEINSVITKVRGRVKDWDFARMRDLMMEIMKEIEIDLDLNLD